MLGLKQSGMFWTVCGANAIIALAMLPPQWPLRNLLGGAPGSMTSTFMSRILPDSGSSTTRVRIVSGRT